MLFTSLGFVLLLMISFLVYYVYTNKHFQVLVLIISSFIFYAYNSPYLLILLISTILINAIVSYLTINIGSISKKKMFTTIGVILNLAILFFFKYSVLFANLVKPFNSEVSNFLISIPLPIGISFFTFQGISLMVDTYKGKVKTNNKKDFFIYLYEITFFKAFFPQLISGPIVKAQDFLPQINIKYFRDIDWSYVFKCLIVGYFLKMVIADNLKNETFWMTYPYFTNISTLKLMIYLFGYSMQIFSDFAGYSLIALGLAKLFGYQFPINFNYPYISKSFSDFWARWHISLSSFLKEYLYIPLGGNRNSKLKTYFNLMIVMVLGGFWHGAALSYAIWGLYHGLLLVLERILTFPNISFLKSKFYVLFKQVLVFVFISFGWLLFKFPNFDYVKLYMISLCSNGNIDTTLNFRCHIILIYSSVVVFYHLFYLFDLKNRLPLIYQELIYAILLFFIFTNSGISEEFIYFQF